VVLVCGNQPEPEQLFEAQQQLAAMAPSEKATAVLLIDLRANNPIAWYLPSGRLPPSLPTPDDIKQRLHEQLLGFMYALVTRHCPLAP
jgi:hypothetical protein